MDDIGDSTIFGKKQQYFGSSNEAAATGGAEDDIDTAPNFTGWGDLADGRFEPLRLLGRGGFAVVYRAFDRKLKRDVALKIPHLRLVPDRQSQQWLLREGHATAALKHPHIVTLYDFQVTGDSGYLVNELVEGPTLAEFISEHPGGCDIRQAVEIVAFIADALEHAHGNEVLHRDVKPSNILLDKNHSVGWLPFSPRLSDFGLASLPSQETLSRPKDSLVGSIQYIPPEVIENPSERFTKQGDIYSLSCILYELLTGKRAFSGSTYSEIINKIVHNNAISLRQLRPAIPKDLAAICYQGMAGSPGKRYARASLLAQDLRNFLNGQPIMARQPSLIEQTRRLIRRHPAVTTACLLVTAALISIITIIGSNNRNLTAINETLANTNTSLEQALEREAITRLQNEMIIYSQDMMSAGEDFQANNLQSVRSILSRYSDGAPLADHRDVEWSFLNRQVRISPDVIWKSQAALYVGCYSSDGNLFATAGNDALITILDARSGEVVRQWESGQSEVNGIVFSSDDRWLWTSGDDGTVRAWTVESGEELWQVQAFSDAAMAYDLVYLPQSDCLIVRSVDHRLQAISATAGQRRGDLEKRDELHNCLKASPSTNQFFTLRA
jgi:eukaryotic-like serine/threonine-protein kinase